MKTKRLEILENSLIKKNALFDEKIKQHFDSVKETNGQPLNDKRNGQATLNKWGRQNNSLHNLKESIAKTERAIDSEEDKIENMESVKETLPTIILDMLESGRLIQWRKHPNTFFVKDVDKARIVWDVKKKKVAHRYSSTITDKVQWKLFAKTFNALYKNLTKEMI